MIKYSGSHDITHCDLETCPSKDSCRRYIAHLDAVKKKLTYLTYVVNDSSLKFEDNKCSIYWPYENSIL